MPNPDEASAALSPLHRLWRMLPAARRRQFLAQTTARMAPKPDRSPPAGPGGIAVLGEVTRASGLGEVARMMARTLAREGIATWLVDSGLGVPGEVPDFAPPPPADIPPGVPLVFHVGGPLMPAAAMRLGRAMMRGRRIVGYWAWELPVLPRDWDVGLRFVHEVWAPTQFVADAVAARVRETGAAVAVQVVPYPVAADWQPVRGDRAAFGLPADALVVLLSFNLSSSFVRKNPLAAIAAFRQAFGGRRDVRLVVKTGKPGHYGADLAAMREALGGADNIMIETRTMSPADNAALLDCSDIVMSLHRSEGFGLVPAEAMLAGKPVVATAWSGNMDFMDAESAALVGYDLVAASDPRGTYRIAGARWAEPRIGEAADWLARLAADPGLRASMGGRAQAMAQRSLGSEALLKAVRAMGSEPASVAV